MAGHLAAILDASGTTQSARILRRGPWHFIGLNFGFFVETAHGAKFFVALFEPLGYGQREYFFQMFEAMRLEILGGDGGIGVRAADRFGNDFIHKLELK